MSEIIDRVQQMIISKAQDKSGQPLSNNQICAITKQTSLMMLESIDMQLAAADTPDQLEAWLTEMEELGYQPTQDDYKDFALRSITDLISNYLYYDRKGDEELPVNAMKELIESGKLTANEISKKFDQELRKAIKENFKV